MMVSAETELHFKNPMSCLRLRRARSLDTRVSLRGILLEIRCTNSRLETSPFLSTSKSWKKWRTSCLVQQGAMKLMNFMNSEKSSCPLWLLSISSKTCSGSSFLSWRMPTISSSFRDSTSPLSRQSTLNSLSSMTAQSAHPCCLTSRQLNRMPISWEVIAGVICRMRLVKEGLLTLWRRKGPSTSLRLMCRRWMSSCTRTRMLLTQLLTAISGDSRPMFLFLTRGCWKTASQLIRRFSSMTRLFRMKSLVLAPILELQGNLRGQLKMLETYSLRLRAGQGVQPQTISQSISPRLQISDLAVQGWFLSS